VGWFCVLQEANPKASSPAKTTHWIDARYWFFRKRNERTLNLLVTACKGIAINLIEFCFGSPHPLVSFKADHLSSPHQHGLFWGCNLPHNQKMSFLREVRLRWVFSPVFIENVQIKLKKLIFVMIFGFIYNPPKRLGSGYSDWVKFVIETKKYNGKDGIYREHEKTLRNALIAMFRFC
jgi:hypothetical protein